MAAPQTPQPGRQPGSAGPRRPRAWLARRTAAILSAVAVFALGGLMYWNDHQSGTAQAATSSSSTSSSNRSGSSDARVATSGGDGESGRESDGEGNGSIVDDITKLIPGLSDNSSSSSSSGSGTSSAGTSSPAPAPHSSTRGS